MFCRNCSSPVGENAAICVKCGVKVGDGVHYCPNCGTETSPNAAVCIQCGVALNQPVPAGEQKSKMTAGLLGIFLGGFKASAVGISAALIFSYLASLMFDPKMKR